MGILCDYFGAATDDEAASVVAGGPLAEPGSAAQRFLVVSAKGIMPPVQTGTLQRILARESPSDDVEDRRNGRLLAGNDAGPWVLTLTEALRDGLANADDAQLRWAAAQWARTDELAADGWTAEDALEVVTELAGLARHATSVGHNLYCWVCL